MKFSTGTRATTTLMRAVVILRVFPEDFCRVLEVIRIARRLYPDMFTVYRRLEAQQQVSDSLMERGEPFLPDSAHPPHPLYKLLMNGKKGVLGKAQCSI